MSTDEDDFIYDEDEEDNSVDLDREYTLFEASRVFGYSMTYLSQLASEGKIETRISGAKHRKSNRSVPVHVVSRETMLNFTRNFSGYQPQGIGRRDGAVRASALKVSEEDKESNRIRVAIEDRMEAKRLGMTYEEYMECTK